MQSCSFKCADFTRSLVSKFEFWNHLKSLCRNCRLRIHELSLQQWRFHTFGHAPCGGLCAGVTVSREHSFFFAEASGEWFLLNVCRIFFVLQRSSIFNLHRERPMFAFVVHYVAGRVLVATGWTQLAAARRFRPLRVGVIRHKYHSVFHASSLKTNRYCVWTSWLHLF